MTDNIHIDNHVPGSSDEILKKGFSLSFPTSDIIIGYQSGYHLDM